MTTAGFFGVIFPSTQFGSVIGGAIVSLLLLVLNTYMKENNLGEMGQKHRQTACDLWLIREKYSSLLTDLAMGEMPIEHLQRERDKLLNDLHTIYKTAPPTNAAAYGQAQAALQKNQELTFSDKEIDDLLHKELSKVKPK
jgi:hypothetical protein